MKKNLQNRGYSFIELISVIALLGIVVAISIPVVGGLNESTRKTVVASDIQTVNQAVKAYLGSGGDLSELSDPLEILTKLKTTQTEEDRRTYVGFTGSMLDPRLTIVPLTEEEKKSAASGISWNTKSQRFEAVEKGGGFSTFVLDSDLAEKDYGTEKREVSSLSYNKDDGWVWAHVEKSAPDLPGATTIPTGIPVDTKPPVPPKLLSPPIFSPPGGTLDISELPFQVTIQNPNDASTWIVYSLNGGEEVQYNGPITLTGDTKVVAYTIGDPALWKQSSNASSSYKFEDLPDPVLLSPPVITLSGTEFNEDSTSVSFDIENPNPAGSSELHYIISVPSATLPNRSNWKEFIGGGAIQYDDYPKGFTITAYAKSLDTLLYIDSPNAQRVVTSSFFGIPLDQDVLIILDASSSMNQNYGGESRYEAVVNETVRAIGHLGNNVKFNVAMFDGGIHWTDGSWKLHPANQHNKDSLISQISVVDNDSGTNYAVGLSLPLMFKPIPKTVIFLSDGEPSGNYSSEVSALQTAGVAVSTIGIGLDADSAANLEAIATSLGGQFVNVSD